MPIVAMTGFTPQPATTPDPDLPALAVRHGATASLRKPFTPDQLLNAIHCSLSGRSAAKDFAPCL
jgi:CheY-like chemotaxis protein